MVWVRRGACVLAVCALWAYRAETRQTVTGAWDYRFGDRSAPEFKIDAEVLSGDRDRIILFHGLRQTPAMWSDAPFRALLPMLRGKQVVLAQLPYARAGLFDDGGAEYCRRFLSSIEEATERLNAKYGKPRKTIAVGFSYGGAHSLIAARSPHVDAFVAISPVTDIHRLREFQWSRNDNCHPQHSALRKKPGFVIYGNRDDRVGSDATAQLVAAYGLPSQQFPIDHTTTPEMIDATAGVIERLSGEL